MSAKLSVLKVTTNSYSVNMEFEGFIFEKLYYSGWYEKTTLFSWNIPFFRKYTKNGRFLLIFIKNEGFGL